MPNPMPRLAPVTTFDQSTTSRGLTVTVILAITLPDNVIRFCGTVAADMAGIESVRSVKGMSRSRPFVRI